MGRVVGIDYGQRRIGLSLSDETETIASPYAVVEGEEALLARLRILYDEEGLDRIVLGLPLNMDGSAGPKA
ncbi:MAG: Holliday junction resolvase RuvX, partial [Planctomycetes bacterium]|nr:Holliday junction resolvase RuvX [Planctomycetota bacterium]